MEQRNIVLVGLMGTGKSTVGTVLAKRLDWGKVDTDHLIEKQEGLTISEIFAIHGETYFRKIEGQILRQVMRQSGQVVATGGGAVLAAENREQMLMNSFVVALTASAKTIIERVKKDQNRPLLQGDLEERVLQIMEQRKHAYDFADMLIDTTDLTADEIVEQIVKKREKKL